jgi:hypothetical protein
LFGCGFRSEWARSWRSDGVAGLQQRRLHASRSQGARMTRSIGTSGDTGETKGVVLTAIFTLAARRFRSGDVDILGLG